jgi:bifunctional non-homologous end joining protein LigD
MPLSWNEVKPGLSIRDFTLNNTFDLLRETGDLFKDILVDGIDLPKIL